MATSSFEGALARVLTYEGGYVDNPKDPGGATNLGVTIGTLSAWLGRPATKAEVRGLTKAGVAPIYRRNYWDAVRGDELPRGVDLVVFDYAVNSGPARSIVALQRALGVANDGHLGPKTLAAAAAIDPATLVVRVCAERLTFLTHLSTWPTFGKGWASRVSAVKAAGIALTTATPVQPGLKPATTPVAPPAPATPVAPPAHFAPTEQTLWQRISTLLLPR